MLHWSLVRLAHCLLVIALNYVYYFEQIKYDADDAAVSVGTY